MLDGNDLADAITTELGITDTFTKDKWKQVANVIIDYIKANAVVTVENIEAGSDTAIGSLE